MGALRLAINGFGRIGRNVLRAFLKSPKSFAGVQIVAINDVADADTLLHLLKFDSTHGRLSSLGVDAWLEYLGGATYLVVAKEGEQWRIHMLGEPLPKSLPWQALDIDVVLECTGRFRSYADASLHRQAGAKQVIIGAAPFDNVDISVVMGVNDDKLTRQHAIISSVSCTTQALVPLLSVLDESYGIKSVMMTEIHAVTADQNILDQAHRDLRRARAGSHNIIPTTSSSIHATERVLPQMKGKINGYSIRVPTINVAAIDVNCVFERAVDISRLNEHLKKTSQCRLQGIMGYVDLPLVSSDFIGDEHSLVVDGTCTMQIGEQTKIIAWYDNEWGYANRLLDVCQVLAGLSD